MKTSLMVEGISRVEEYIVGKVPSGGGGRYTVTPKQNPTI